MRYVAAVVLMVGALAGTAWAQALERVDFVAGSIFDVKDGVVTLLDGSKWLTSGFSTLVVAENVVIVTRDVNGISGRRRLATLYGDGDEVPVRLLGGSPPSQSGYLTSVVAEMGDGAVLRLADGSLWSVPEYDRFDTGFWLPPYKALLAGNRLYLWNLKKGKRVWVSAMK